MILDSEKEYLKSCPFCGGTARRKQNYNAEREQYFVFVKCDVCGAEGKKYASDTPADKDEWNNWACLYAARAWNNRPYSADNLPELINLTSGIVVNHLRSRGLIKEDQD